jgi:hypothetical protein
VGHAENILTWLSAIKCPVCDDCIASRTSIQPRQTVNQICRQLADAHTIERSRLEVCALCRGEKVCNRAPPSGTHTPAAPGSPSAPRDGHGLWHWEGNIQDVLIAWLRASGWTITSEANTAAKSPGKDIIAQREDRTLWVSVKGFPRGTAKTNAATQARHWFSHAVFDVVCYRTESSTAELAIGLPDGFQTYHRLARRLAWLQDQLPLLIFWVDPAGHVRVESATDEE